MNDKFFVTTPIYYVNAKPHIGSAYPTIAADIVARYYRNKLGRGNVFFLTGTDENAQKNVTAAGKEGLSIQDYVDKLAIDWKGYWAKLDIAYDDFIRTTEERHVKTVQDFFKKLLDSGYIYQGTYEGLYCVGHEAFLKPEDLIGGLCPDHKTKPERIKENNYFFKLSEFQGKLLKLYEDNPDWLEPDFRKNEVVNFIKTGLEDISVTRETQKWGIKAPVPSEQVVYVWFDALINYYTAGKVNQKSQDFWPADLHIIGKDLTRFHCVIWPAMLLAAGLPLPKKVFAHGFFTVDNTKISKSLGNAVDPIELAEKYGVDAVRYYLFSQIPFGQDGDFSIDHLEEVYTADLANGWGNLVQRVTTLLAKNKIELIFDKNQELSIKKQVDEKIESLAFHEALQLIRSEVSKVDKYLEREKPWLLKEEKTRQKEVLLHAAEKIWAINKLYEPFLPETTEEVTTKLKGKQANLTEPLFPRLNQN